MALPDRAALRNARQEVAARGGISRRASETRKERRCVARLRRLSTAGAENPNGRPGDEKTTCETGYHPDTRERDARKVGGGMRQKGADTTRR